MAKITARMKDLTGQRFGRLTVLEFAGRKNRHRYWKCRCSCGAVKIIEGSHLKCGKAKSCGCLHKEIMTIHNGSKTKEFWVWAVMKQRCLNPRNKYYKYYGGRGITVCDRWMLFKNFIADMGKCPLGLQIDRIDNDGNYEMGNCRWTDRKTQQRNKRTNRILEFRGKKLCVVEWAEKFSIPLNTIYGRLWAGHSLEKVFSKEPLPNSGQFERSVS